MQIQVKLISLIKFIVLILSFFKRLNKYYYFDIEKQKTNAVEIESTQNIETITNGSQNSQKQSENHESQSLTYTQFNQVQTQQTTQQLFQPQLHQLQTRYESQQQYRIEQQQNLADESYYQTPIPTQSINDSFYVFSLHSNLTNKDNDRFNADIDQYDGDSTSDGSPYQNISP